MRKESHDCSLGLCIGCKERHDFTFGQSIDPKERLYTFKKAWSKRVMAPFIGNVLGLMRFIMPKERHISLFKHQRVISLAKAGERIVYLPLNFLNGES